MRLTRCTFISWPQRELMRACAAGHRMSLISTRQSISSDALYLSKRLPIISQPPLK